VCFCFYFLVAHHALHSFPTRRSSDLFSFLAGRELEVQRLGPEAGIAGGQLVELEAEYLGKSRAGDRPHLVHRHRSPELASCPPRSEEHTSELQSPYDLVCRLLLEKKK